MWVMVLLRYSVLFHRLVVLASLFLSIPPPFRHSRLFPSRHGFGFRGVECGKTRTISGGDAVFSELAFCRRYKNAKVFDRKKFE